MIKITGALIIIVSSCLIGFAAGEHEKEYINILLSLKRCLVIIKSEISYAYTPLIDIFARLSGMKQEEWSVFLMSYQKKLHRRYPEKRTCLICGRKYVRPLLFAKK